MFFFNNSIKNLFFQFFSFDEMGTCCGRISSSNDQQQIKLPKMIVIPEHSLVIFLEKHQTNSSNRLKNSLKNHIPTLLIINGEEKLLKYIERIEHKNIYLISTNKIHRPTMKNLLNNDRIKAIYFSHPQFDPQSYPQSNQIKGFYSDSYSLKKSIYSQIRSDEEY